MNEHERRILEEDYFKFANLSYKEALLYLNIIQNCKEIKDTIFKVNDCSSGEIVSLSLKKDNNNITFNGYVSYDKENRIIDGTIYDKDVILVDMHINRLCVNENNVYTTVDEFKNDKQITTYNNSLGTYEEKINIK